MEPSKFQFNIPECRNFRQACLNQNENGEKLLYKTKPGKYEFRIALNHRYSKPVGGNCRTKLRKRQLFYINKFISLDIMY